MCAVYPWRSPGGWHLLGRTPLALFDAGPRRPGAGCTPATRCAGRPSTRGRYDALEQRRRGRRAAARSLARQRRRAAMSGVLEFVDAGAGVSIQDLGRIGHRAHRRAAGRRGRPGAAGLRQRAAGAAARPGGAGSGPARARRCGRVGAPVQLALAGDFAPRLTRADGSAQPLASWRSLTLQPGDMLARRARAAPASATWRWPAAVDVPPVLGSRSTYARAGLGGIDGRAPRAGDRLRLRRRAAAHERQARAALRACRRRRCACCRARRTSTSTPRPGRCSSAATTASSREADRMGLRLEGPPLQHRAGQGADIVSEAVVPGAVQVPGDGQPIVLGVDAPDHRRLRQDRHGDPRRPAAPGACAPRAACCASQAVTRGRGAGRTARAGRGAARLGAPHRAAARRRRAPTKPRCARQPDQRHDRCPARRAPTPCPGTDTHEPRAASTSMPTSANASAPGRWAATPPCCSSSTRPTSPAASMPATRW